jgi:cytochrome P450
VNNVAKIPPPHGPQAPIIEFDLYNLPGMVNGFTDDVHALWKQVQDTTPDVFWTPLNGGHWVVTRYREIARICTEPHLFSNSDPFVPIGMIPHTGPSQLDAPEHMPFRKLVSMAFTPASLSKANLRARAAAAAIVEQLKPKGRCNFMADFAGVMPIITFLNLLGMPESEAPYLRQLSERMVPGQPEMVAANAEATQYIEDLIHDRQNNPGDDFVSMLVHAQVMGRDLTPVERLNVVRLVVTGGLDTVINTMSFAVTHFARHPELQRELRENPDLYDGAVNEIVRRFGISNLGRIAREDLELGGVTIRKGDQVLGIFPLAGLDERVNPDPMTFDPRRRNARHMDFGSGPHTCLGARLALREIRVFLEEWLAKMPQFSIVPGTAPRMSSGIINTMRDLQLQWD